MFTGLREHIGKCETFSIKPFVAPEEDDKLPTEILLSGQDAMWVM